MKHPLKAIRQPYDIKRTRKRTTDTQSAGLCEKKNLDNKRVTCYIRHMLSVQQKIRAIIAEKKLSIYQVARGIGIDHANLYRSLADGSNLELNTMTKVLDYLGYKVTFVKQSCKKRKQ